MVTKTFTPKYRRSAKTNMTEFSWHFWNQQPTLRRHPLSQLDHTLKHLHVSCTGWLTCSIRATVRPEGIRANGGIVPLILNLSTQWCWSVSRLSRIRPIPEEIKQRNQWTERRVKLEVKDYTHTHTHTHTHTESNSVITSWKGLNIFCRYKRVLL
jgi:hypothetical protein